MLRLDKTSFRVSLLGSDNNSKECLGNKLTRRRRQSGIRLEKLKGEKMK
jgi:hypothetical protein